MHEKLGYPADVVRTRVSRLAGAYQTSEPMECLGRMLLRANAAAAAASVGGGDATGDSACLTPDAAATAGIDGADASKTVLHQHPDAVSRFLASRSSFETPCCVLSQDPVLQRLFTTGRSEHGVPRNAQRCRPRASEAVVPQQHGNSASNTAHNGFECNAEDSVANARTEVLRWLIGTREPASLAAAASTGIEGCHALAHAEVMVAAYFGRLGHLQTLQQRGIRVIELGLEPALLGHQIHVLNWMLEVVREKAAVEVAATQPGSEGSSSSSANGVAIDDHVSRIEQAGVRRASLAPGLRALHMSRNYGPATRTTLPEPRLFNAQILNSGCSASRASAESSGCTANLPAASSAGGPSAHAVSWRWIASWLEGLLAPSEPGTSASPGLQAVSSSSSAFPDFVSLPLALPSFMRIPQQLPECGGEGTFELWPVPRFSGCWTLNRSPPELNPAIDHFKGPRVCDAPGVTHKKDLRWSRIVATCVSRTKGLHSRRVQIDRDHERSRWKITLLRPRSSIQQLISHPVHDARVQLRIISQSDTHRDAGITARGRWGKRVTDCCSARSGPCCPFVSPHCNCQSTSSAAVCRAVGATPDRSRPFTSDRWIQLFETNSARVRAGDDNMFRC